MKTFRIFLLAITLSLSAKIMAQETAMPQQAYWQIGIGLGELPMGGSFKPSITFGYHFNDNLYAGIIYQFKDEISRDEASFNAKSTGLDGPLSSNETVAQRFLFQMRYTPVKHGPYISTGFVFNGKDTETMQFSDGNRTIAGEEYQGDIQIQQTRPAGWGFALGLGYQYNFKNGFSAGFEWTPAWFQYPTPSYTFDGSAALSKNAQNHLKKEMDEGFKSSVTNMYKVFHLGVAYRFQ